MIQCASWSSLPGVHARIKPFGRFCFGRSVRANHVVTGTVNVIGQICIRNMRVRANHARNAVTEHYFLHISGFFSSSVVIKRYCHGVT